MPTIGEIKSGKELGFKVKRTTRSNPWDYSKYIWHGCLACGKERWIRFSKTKIDSFSGYCKECSDKIAKIEGDKHPRWKGGRWKDGAGYIGVTITPDSFFFPMANRHRVKEHRLIMAQHLKRCLLPWEVVHHKNGIRDDNRLENLQLLPHARWHLVSTQARIYIVKLEKRIAELEKRLAYQ